nr:MAG TPA: hypothetical protein [Caudoviricetes sp.]
MMLPLRYGVAVFLYLNIKPSTLTGCFFSIRKRRR